MVPAGIASLIEKIYIKLIIFFKHASKIVEIVVTSCI